MLQHLFHSPIRFKLLRFFLTEEEKFYFPKEIAEKIKGKERYLQKELKNLENLGLVKIKKVEIDMTTAAAMGFLVPQRVRLGPRDDNKTTGFFPRRNVGIRMTKKKKRLIFKILYQINTKHLLYPELKALFLKSRLLLEDILAKKIQKIGQVRLLILTGFFVNLPLPTDLLIVGRVNRKRLKNLIKKFEKDLGRPINYTVMSTQEFKYRHDLTDQFLFNILENRKMVVMDRIMNQESGIRNQVKK